MIDLCPYAHQLCKDRVSCQHSLAEVNELYRRAKLDIDMEPKGNPEVTIGKRLKYVEDHFKDCPQAQPIISPGAQRKAEVQKAGLL